MIQSLIEDTEYGIRQLEDKIEDYEEFIDWLDSADRTFDELSNEEQNAFKDVFNEYTRFTDETVPEEEVTEIKQELADALRQPAQRGLQEQTATIIDQFGVEKSGALTRSLKAEIQALDQDVIPANRDMLKEVGEVSRDLSEPSRQYIRKEITNNPNILFEHESESDHLLNLVNQVREREEKLEEVASLTESYEWINVTDRELGFFTKKWLSKSLPDTDTVISKLDQLDEYYNSFSSTVGDISTLLSKRVDNIFSEPSDGLIDPLTNLISNIDPVTDAVEQIEDLHEAKQISKELDHSIPTGVLEELPRLPPDKKIESVNELEKIADNLSDIHSRWSADMASNWESDAQILTNLSEQFGVTEPDVLNDVDSIRELSRQNPAKAVRQLNSLHDGLADLRDDIREATDLGDDAVDLLLDLIAEQSVSISRYGIEPVESLNDQIDLEVSINDSAQN